jgi:hypothetical protein
VQEFEKIFLAHMRDVHPEVAEEIQSTKQLSDGGKATIEAAAREVIGQLTA